MRESLKFGVALGALVLAIGCREPPPGPDVVASPALAGHGVAECPAVADFVVTDEASLLAALSAASPEDVIAVDGFFGVTADVLITTDDLTITCATPGSGLFAEPGAVVFDILNALARGVRVERLFLDGSATLGGPYFASNNGATFFGDDVRFTKNTAICGPRSCAFLVGSAGARVEDNHFESAGSLTGVHFQGQGPRSPEGMSARPIDGSRVKDNTIIATAPSALANFGGIRARDGSGVEVEDNVVIGPWANSVSVANLLESEVDANKLEGPALFGIATSVGGFNPPISTRDNEFEGNSIIGPGSRAIFVRLACRNEFDGNELVADPLDLSIPDTVVFEVTTGANTFEGTPNVVVFDDGDFDCDGDGIADPNNIDIGDSDWDLAGLPAHGLVSPQLLRGINRSVVWSGRPLADAKAVDLQ